MTSTWATRALELLRVGIATLRLPCTLECFHLQGRSMMPTLRGGPGLCDSDLVVGLRPGHSVRMVPKAGDVVLLVDENGRMVLASKPNLGQSEVAASNGTVRSQWALPDFICQLQIAVGAAGLQLPATDRSGHCRTSAATARSQWALSDFSRDCQIAVGTAGLQPRAPDRSGHCRASAASSRSQWALPDFNRELQIAVGTAGLQPRAPDRSGHCRTSAASSRFQWALPERMSEKRRSDR
eukprot:s1409_g10.t1